MSKSPIAPSSAEILPALKRDEIIPDIIPLSLDFKPSIALEVTFPNGTQVLLGNTIARDLTEEAPTVKFVRPEADGKDTVYAVAMTDPDVPSRAEPVYRQARHWLVCISFSSLFDPDT